MANMKMKISLTPELQAFFRNAPDKFAVASANALYQEAELVMTASKEQVPVDTGRLRNTGYVELPKIDSDKISVEMGYNTVYARRQHEELNYLHTVGKAKYLEDPLNEAKPNMPGNIAKSISKDVDI